MDPLVALLEQLKEPYIKTGDFALRYRYIHLTYAGHPPGTPMDPFWLVAKLHENLAEAKLSIGDFSASCVRVANSPLFDPPLTGIVTLVAIQLKGKEDVRQFRFVAEALLTVLGKAPGKISIVTLEEHWKAIFAYHREAGLTLSQSTDLHPWPGRPKLPKCPYGGNTVRFCDYRTHYDCPACLPGSFVQSERSKQLRAPEGGEVPEPRMIPLASTTMYTFQCDKCPHSFMTSPGLIESRSAWCQYCAKKALCGKKECTGCHERSISAHPAADTLINKDIDKERVPISSNKFLKFCCRLCGHDYEARVFCVTGTTGNYCPYCCKGGRRVCPDVNCRICFERRFINHPDAQRARKLPDNPHLLTVASNKVASFLCPHDLGHKDYPMKICNVTVLRYGCPECKDTTEKKVYDYLVSEGYTVSKQPRVPRPSGRGHPYRGDMLVTIPERDPIVVEVDGHQHWAIVERWGGASGLVVRMARDVYKALYFINNGMRIIRIHQLDVTRDKFGWRSELVSCIEDEDAKPIEYLEAPGKDTWKVFRDEMATLDGQTPKAWAEKNRERLEAADNVGDDEEEAPAGTPACTCQKPRGRHTPACPIRTANAGKRAAKKAAAAAAVGVAAAAAAATVDGSQREEASDADDDEDVEALTVAMGQAQIRDPAQSPRATRAARAQREEAAEAVDEDMDAITLALAQVQLRDPAQSPRATRAARAQPTQSPGSTRAARVQPAQSPASARVAQAQPAQSPASSRAAPVPRGVACTCTRPQGPGRRPHDPGCARYAPPPRAAGAVAGAGRPDEANPLDELRDMELAIAGLEPDQRDAWSVHSVTLIAYLRAIPANVDEALTILSVDFSLPKAFLGMVFAATSQM
jgi:hypothetical protein